MADNSPRRAELRALCEAAGKAPWHSCSNFGDHGEPLVYDADNRPVLVMHHADHDSEAYWEVSEDNERFIVESRTALPELLDENERLERGRDAEHIERLRLDRELHELFAEHDELRAEVKQLKAAHVANYESGQQMARQLGDMHSDLATARARVAELEEKRPRCGSPEAKGGRCPYATPLTVDDLDGPDMRALATPPWLTPELRAAVERWLALPAEKREELRLRTDGAAYDVLWFAAAALSPAEPAEEQR